MRTGYVSGGLILFVVGVVLGLYASQRNCLIAFLTEGYMNFWTGIEILAGFTALAGLIVTLVGLVRRKPVGD